MTRNNRPPVESGNGLPVLTPAPGLRADAVRNKGLLLDAASSLMDSCGAERLTMEAVASAAGVGKGTVFRRFGSRAGLFAALLDHRESRLQAAFLSGPPPLGPDAPPRERLLAFGPALIAHDRSFYDVVRATRDDPERAYAIPATRLRETHLAMLLREAGSTGDTLLQAHTLLASVDAVLVHHLLTERGVSRERIEAGWRDLVERLLHDPG
ncbi:MULTISPECIES: TetR/AcrR family transcriptional regulator [unclassified Streptomyces]|uniref:TetR/AcrR family transcriptional regulator n=1 Tax=unclassified Streptomyces TaxID=2593676 RepID=UPI001ADA1579|nr:MULTISPECIES: TetR/AcrR family transcriptional regulator [unclassified Streptomyces]WEH26261.1 helix-turn-helix domain containing protein [Streptomyces sp. AM 3-1-1]